jgi:hypothetical protein
MEKIIVVEKNKENYFYKKIKWLKILKSKNYTFSIEYCEHKYKNNTKKTPKKLYMILNIISILNTKDKKEMYGLIYDYSCEYLDNEFSCKNICDFKDDMCIYNRSKNKGIKVSSCCERNRTRIICEKFDKVNKCCTIKCIGCKLFTCRYLRKKGIKYKANDIPYLKYFLSPRQKKICENLLYIDKDEIINKWMKFYYLP